MLCYALGHSLGDLLHMFHNPGRALLVVVEFRLQDHRRGRGFVHLIEGFAHFDASPNKWGNCGNLPINLLGQFFGLAAFGADPAFAALAAAGVAVQGQMNVRLFGVAVRHNLLEAHFRPIAIDFVPVFQLLLHQIAELIHPLLFCAIVPGPLVILLGAGG
jgi:hypothetical protein